MSITPLPKVAEVFHEFPLRLIKPLRSIVDASSASDALTKYGNFFDTLIGYLADLANSVYAAQDTSSANDKIEKELRNVKLPLTMGRKNAGFGAFGPIADVLKQKIPELEPLLKDLRLPPACIRMTRAFMAIETGCRNYGVSPSHLSKYVDDQLRGGSNSFTLYQMCKSLVEVRNASAHVGADTWFPNDVRMFEIACRYLAPATDELLTWAPMKSLLTKYEVVEVQAPANASSRICPIARIDLGDGRGPLGASSLHLTEGIRAQRGVCVVALRTEHPSKLEGLVPYIKFPTNLLSHEHINRSYADIYLRAYLESGLITAWKRENELSPKVKELAVRAPKDIEAAVQAALKCDSGDPAGRRACLTNLAELCGEHWAAQQDRVEAQLPTILERRKKHIFDLIDNNGLMTFMQLRTEVELDPQDLEEVLVELTKEGRVSDLPGKRYKAHDPTYRARLLALLGEMASAPHRPHLPIQALEIVKLCATLLQDDGVPVSDADLDQYKVLFDLEGTSTPDQADSEDSMQLLVGDRVLRPRNVRDLFKQLMATLVERKVDFISALPWTLGRSRYLAAQEPLHSNGTPFKNPIQVGSVAFEGNVGRVQALSETIRLLAHFGIEASSPDIEQPRSEPDTVEDVVESDDEDESESEVPEDAPTLLVCPPGSDESFRVTGPTVRRFLAALLDILIEHGADIGSVAPVSTGRVRYLLAEEPYHRNGRAFDAWIERDGYCINVAYTYEQAVAVSEQLCRALGWTVLRPNDASRANGTEPLLLEIGDQTITADDVPSFFRLASAALYDQEILTQQDIPYKLGYTRYLIAREPRHENGGDFIRPIEVVLGGVRYWMEANVGRAQAVQLIERIARKR